MNLVFVVTTAPGTLGGRNASDVDLTVVGTDQTFACAKFKRCMHTLLYRVFTVAMADPVILFSDMELLSDRVERRY